MGIIARRKKISYKEYTLYISDAHTAKLKKVTYRPNTGIVSAEDTSLEISSGDGFGQTLLRDNIIVTTYT